jgi:hypothetical protein
MPVGSSPQASRKPRCTVLTLTSLREALAIWCLMCSVKILFPKRKLRDYPLSFWFSRGVSFTPQRTLAASGDSLDVATWMERYSWSLQVEVRPTTHSKDNSRTKKHLVHDANSAEPEKPWWTGISLQSSESPQQGSVLTLLWRPGWTGQEAKLPGQSQFSLAHFHGALTVALEHL